MFRIVGRVCSKRRANQTWLAATQCQPTTGKLDDDGCSRRERAAHETITAALTKGDVRLARTQVLPFAADGTVGDAVVGVRRETSALTRLQTRIEGTGDCPPIYLSGSPTSRTRLSRRMRAQAASVGAIANAVQTSRGAGVSKSVGIPAFFRYSASENPSKRRIAQARAKVGELRISLVLRRCGAGRHRRRCKRDGRGCRCHTRRFTPQRDSSARSGVIAGTLPITLQS
jgi:hypothetical protein